MNTGPEERLSYRELARQQARLERVISLHKFSRLHSLAGHGSDPETGVGLAIEFYIDDQQWPCVRGSAQTTIELLCNRCAEMVQYPLEANWDFCIVDETVVDEQTLSVLAESRDLLSVDSASVSVVDIAEDELLLALPERLCRSEPCELMPDLAYPADSRAEQPESADQAGGDEVQRRKPFAGLADLMAEQQTNSGADDSSGQDDGSDDRGEQR